MDFDGSLRIPKLFLILFTSTNSQLLQLPHLQYFKKIIYLYKTKINNKNTRGNTYANKLSSMVETKYIGYRDNCDLYFWQNITITFILHFQDSDLWIRIRIISKINSQKEVGIKVFLTILV
jgi:hypothetical protein